jgi:phage gpG-like protein
MAKAQRFINVDFKPNLRTVEQDFVRLSERLEDKHEVMLASMAVARHDIGEMFDGEHDAMGKAWEPWKSESPPSGSNKPYADRAEEFPNIGILQRNGDLREQAMQSSQFAIEGNHLTYGSDLPEWAGVHLHGGLQVFEDGYRIPQRSFYPYSPEGVAKVHAVFDAWAAHTIEIMERTSKRGKTYVQIQTRTPTGQFGSSPL